VERDQPLGSPQRWTWLIDPRNTNQRMTGLGDNHLFSGECALNQPGEVSLRLMDVDFHNRILA
jgi:hypothetical protein